MSKINILIQVLKMLIESTIQALSGIVSSILNTFNEYFQINDILGYIIIATTAIAFILKVVTIKVNKNR